MHKRNTMFLAPLVIVSVALLVVWGGAASAAGTRTGGVVHLYAAQTLLDGTVDTEVYTGAIADYGTDHQGLPGGNLVALSKGSFRINANDLGNKLGSSVVIDPKTCAFAGSATGPFPIVQGTGTGAYRGISGTFELTVTEAGILPRLKNGECATHAAGQGVLFAEGSGTVSYK